MIKVLLIDDSPAGAAHIMELLCEARRENVAVTYEACAADAVRRLESESFDAALVRLSGVRADDLAGLAAIKRQAPALPVVLLCTHGERDAAIAATKCGAEDYIEEGDHSGELIARSLRYAIERVSTAERLAFLSRHDTLTGLVNRTAFRDRVIQALARSDRSGRPGALLLFDLDSFQAINDTRGHDIGDLFLRHVADQMRKCVRPYDVVARLGGDEFGILLEDVNDARDAGRLAERLLESITTPFVVGNHEVFGTASLGAVVFPFDGADPTTLLRNADFAMYRAKRHGGGTAAFYTPSMGERIHQQLSLEHDLHRALARDEFLVHYQPQVSVHTGRLVGLEALVRWQHPEGALIPWNAFLPAAEKSGTIGAIGAWALHTACRQRREWADARLAFGRIAVNLSPRQLVGDGFVAIVGKTLRDVGLDPNLLELEITEELFYEHDPVTIEKLASLRRLGIRISIDDFGTGYSCLSRLTDLPIDALKIDRSLVGRAAQGRQDGAVARAILVLAHELGLAVLCESVETKAQAEFLREHGCEAVQGELVSPPLPPEEIPAWAAARGRIEAGAPPSSDPSERAPW